MDRVWVEQTGLDELAKGFNTTAEKMEKASRLAANKAMRDMRTPIKKAYAKEIGIAQKHIEKRIIYRAAHKGGAGRRRFAILWIGLNPIPATRRIFRNLKQEARGAWAKNYFFLGGFVAKMPKTGHIAIWQSIGAISPKTGREMIEREEVEAERPEIRSEITKQTRRAQTIFANELERLIEKDLDKIGDRVRIASPQNANR